MEWAISKGGPLILMEKRLLRDWRGCLTSEGVPAFDDPEHWTDYDRACAVSSEEFVTNISVGNGQALVFAPPPLMGTFIHSRDARLCFLLSDDTDEGVISNVDFDNLVPNESARFSLITDEVIAFDSATPGTKVIEGKDAITNLLKHGNYLVEIMEIESLFISVNRFTLQC